MRIPTADTLGPTGNEEDKGKLKILLVGAFLVWQILRWRETDKERESEREREREKERVPVTVCGRYNILAGYLGNNMEPWFLYGVNMPDERRRAIFRMHREKLPNGDHANFGWPKYVPRHGFTDLGMGHDGTES